MKRVSKQYFKVNGLRLPDHYEKVESSFDYINDPVIAQKRMQKFVEIAKAQNKSFDDKVELVSTALDIGQMSEKTRKFENVSLAGLCTVLHLDKDQIHCIEHGLKYNNNDPHLLFNEAPHLIYQTIEHNQLPVSIPSHLPTYQKRGDIEIPSTGERLELKTIDKSRLFVQPEYSKYKPIPHIIGYYWRYSEKEKTQVEVLVKDSENLSLGEIEAVLQKVCNRLGLPFEDYEKYVAVRLYDVQYPVDSRYTIAKNYMTIVDKFSGKNGGDKLFEQTIKKMDKTNQNNSGSKKPFDKYSFIDQKKIKYFVKKCISYVKKGWVLIEQLIELLINLFGGGDFFPF